jgi:hypothetical protein
MEAKIKEISLNTPALNGFPSLSPSNGINGISFYSDSVSFVSLSNVPELTFLSINGRNLREVISDYPNKLVKLKNVEFINTQRLEKTGIYQLSTLDDQLLADDSSYFPQLSRISFNKSNISSEQFRILMANSPVFLGGQNTPVLQINFETLKGLPVENIKLLDARFKMIIRNCPLSENLFTIFRLTKDHTCIDD